MKYHHKQFVIIFIYIFVLSFLYTSLITPMTAFAVFDDDAYFNTCGCSQEVLRDKVANPNSNKYCEDNAHPDGVFDFYASTPIIPSPFSLFGILGSLIFGSLDDEPGKWVRGALSNVDDPQIHLAISTPSPMKGDRVEFVVENRDYTRPVEDDARLTVWSKNGVTMQGVVAGGKEVTPVPILKDKDGNQIGDNPHTVYNNKSSCQLAGRNWVDEGDTDDDGDGMGDQWERDNFPGKNIETEVLPGDDPDHDGFQITEPKRLNGVPLRNFLPLGETVKLAPDSVAGITGDGKFTNYEEYIWGTDPNAKDTDQDGTVDEADVSGVDQDEFAYTAKGEGVLVDKVRATTVGKTSQRRVFINSEEKNVIINNMEAFQIELAMSPEEPDVEHLPVITVEPVNPVSDDDFIEYTWYMNGERLGDEFNGLGKKELDFSKHPELVGDISGVAGASGNVHAQIINPDDPDPQPGHGIPDNFHPLVPYEIRVDVLETTTLRNESALKKFRIGVGAILDYTTLNHAYMPVPGRPEEPYPECQNDPCKCPPVDQDMDPLKVGKDEYVQVTASGDFSEVGNSTDFPALNYSWYIDSERQLLSSGMGKDTLCFQATNEPSELHHVELQIVHQRLGRMEAQGELDIHIVGIETIPSNLQFFPENPRSGESVLVTAGRVNNVPPGGTVSYEWRLDGDVVEHDSSSSAFRFDAGYPGQKHIVDLVVTVMKDEKRFDEIRIQGILDVSSEPPAEVTDAQSQKTAQDSLFFKALSSIKRALLRGL